MKEITSSNEIGKLIREMENDYTSGTPVKISEYVEMDMYEELNRIDAYDNSKHVSGDKDSKGRDKPFMNVVKAVINIWNRATDIDRKNIRIYSNNVANYISSFVATIYLHNWMKHARFGKFLNQWGRKLAKYGSAVTKFVEKDGELIASVVDWHKLICDPIDFDSNPVIEVLDLTPTQLKSRGYDEEVVKGLLDDVTSRKDLKGIEKDDRADYIRVYELHGKLPLSFLTDDEDDAEDYEQMMIVYSFTGSEDDGFTDYYLYRGREKNPYMLTHLLEEDGKTLSTGSVKQLFETQWMVNHSIKAMKDQLDLASKLIFQTSDKNFLGKNVISAVETGDIMIHDINQPVTKINNDATDITSVQNFQSMWQQSGNEQTGASDAMRGVQPKAGSAWRQTEAILQENHSLFELMTENKGLHLEDMLRVYVLPFIKKKLNNKDSIVTILDSFNLKKLDKMYLSAKAQEMFEAKAKKQIKESLLQGEIPEFIDVEAEMAQNQEELQKNLSELGNERFIVPSEVSEKTWKEVFKDLEWEVEVDITGEQRDVQSHLTTLNNLFVNMMQTGQVEDGRKVLEKILELTGAFSPIELTQLQAQPVPQAPRELMGEVTE